MDQQRGGRRWVAPLVTAVLAAILFLLWPVLWLVSQADANCGDAVDGFDHPCARSSDPALTTVPLVAAAVALAAWVALWIVPPRLRAVRFAIAVLVVLAPLVAVVAAYTVARPAM